MRSSLSHDLTRIASADGDQREERSLGHDILTANRVLGEAKAWYG